MATKNQDPLSAGLGGGDPISAQFGKARTMLGASPAVTATGGGGGPLGLAPEGVTSDQDSLTQMIRSLTNLTGTQGAGILNSGQGTTNAGLGITQGGLDLFGAPVDYYSKLLSGDPTAFQQALAPEAAAISQQFEGAKDAAGRTMPRGGFASSTIANLPFAEAGKVGDAALKIRPDAAKALTGIAGQEAGIGQGVAQTGLAQSGLGLQELTSAIQALLGRRDQNNQVDMNNISNLTKGLTGTFEPIFKTFV